MKVGTYIHIPFCVQRCTYCDFNTYTGMLDLQDAYTDALCEEIRLRSERYRGIESRTLYFGGGTPSLMRVENVQRVVDAARRYFELPWDAEVTLEANPGTLDYDKLTGLRHAGINRLSLGIQSSHSHELLLLGRIHTWHDAVEVVQMARDAGFDNLSIDLIYGLPNQSVDQWRSTLEATLALEPEHLSLYGLTLEPGTPLAELITLHDLEEIDPDVAADMYLTASMLLHEAGFWQYEISNWARGIETASSPWDVPTEHRTEAVTHHASQHNLIYWRYEPWLGIGAGAHASVMGRHYVHHPHPRSYINAIQQGKLKPFEEERITRDTAITETMLMGLRLAEGVPNSRILQRYGTDLNTVYGPVIRRFVGMGLLEWNGEWLRLTPEGRLLGNQVFIEFLLG